MLRFRGSAVEVAPVYHMLVDSSMIASVCGRSGAEAPSEARPLLAQSTEGAVVAIPHEVLATRCIVLKGSTC